MFTQFFTNLKEKIIKQGSWFNSDQELVFHKFCYKYGFWLPRAYPWIKKVLVTIEDYASRNFWTAWIARGIHLSFGLTIFYLDHGSGNNANDGSTWLLAWRDITNGATAARIAAADVIRMAKSPDPTSLGMTATFTDLSKTVTLNSALTADIDDCEAAWTPSTNVTSTATGGNYKEGTKAVQIAIAAGFTTGKAAYKTISATDFSGYQQISLYMSSTVVLTAGHLQLKLCSDTAGATPVDTFDIPAHTVTGIGNYKAITIDKGSALGSSIQSIALYVVTDFGAVTVNLDNIIACKASGSADSLSLTSLIGKNTGNEGWYGIQSIRGTTVLLDNGAGTLATAGKGYTGTTETVTAYKRETFKMTATTSQTTGDNVVQDSGAVGSYIEFQGGYNTSNTTQDGETFIDGQHSFGAGILLNGVSWIKLNRLSCVRFVSGILINNSAHDIYIDTINTLGNNGSDSLRIITGTNYNITVNEIKNCINNASTGITLGTLTNSVFGNLRNLSNNNTASGLSISSSTKIRFNSIGKVRNNGTLGFSFNCSEVEVLACDDISNNGEYGIFFPIGARNNKLCVTSISNNGIGGVQNTGAKNNYLKNTVIADAVEVTNDHPFSDGRVISINHDNTPGYIKHFIDWGETINDSVVYRISGSKTWKLSPLSTNRDSTYPLFLEILPFEVNANTLVTIGAWMRRDSASVTGSLVCRGGQIGGVANDVSSSITVTPKSVTSITRSGSTATVTCTGHGYVTGNSICISGAVESDYNGTFTITRIDDDTFTYPVANAPSTPATGTIVAAPWEYVTITFTPNERGVVMIEVWAYGGTTNSVWIDSIHPKQV